WRTLSGTTLLNNAIEPGAGATSTQIVIAGGRTTANQNATATRNTQILDIPTMTTPNPTFSAGPQVNVPRWGAAYTVDAGMTLWMIGGSNGSTCVGTTESLAMPNGTWSSGPSLPNGDVLCQATAVTAGGAIVVTGGSTRPVVSAFDTPTSNNKT